jgi:PBP1b-binding outer membrane lipoprotein LpoB
MKQVILSVTVLVAAMAFSGCKKEPTASDQLNSLKKQGEQAANDVGKAVDKAAADVKKAADEAAKK